MVLTRHAPSCRSLGFDRTAQHAANVLGITALKKAKSDLARIGLRKHDEFRCLRISCNSTAMKPIPAISCFLLTCWFASGATTVSGIINSDTTWTAAGSPYQLTGTVQVAYGRTLTIAAGASVAGNGRLLEIFGNLVVAGTQANRVSILGLAIAPGGNSPSTPSSMDIRFANIDGGSLWAPRGLGTYSSISIRDSIVTNLGGGMIYLWYPVVSCAFERNTFINSAGFSVGFDTRTTTVQIVFRNNVFFAPQLGTSPQTSAAICCWASYGGSVVVEANSFLNITGGYALSLPAGYNSASITAPNNYWGGLDNAAVSALIFDRNDDLNSATIVPFQPIRQSADPATPAAPAIPAILSQSPSQSVQEGASATLSVNATGNPSVSFQWRKDGLAISGATNSSLLFAPAAPSNTGSYSVVVSNLAGTTTSGAISLTVLPNVSAPQITSQPLSQTVTAGNGVLLSVNAIGVPAPTYQWSRNGAVIAGESGNTLLLNNASSSTAGSYSVVASNSAGTAASNVALVTVIPASALSNLSVRTALATGQTLIVGAFVSGGSKAVLVRAAGPALNKFGLAGFADPRLELYTSGIVPIAINDDWASSLSPVFASVGAFAFDPGSKDAALSQPLSGSFSVQAKGSGAGTVLVEAYDVAGGVVPRLTNLSARNLVGTGPNILIAGFAISGTGTKQVLIRAIGPALAAFGVSGALADPKMEVFGSNGVLIGANDNWQASLAPIMTQVGGFALAVGSRDAALLLNLNANASYSVQVSGADGGTGEALVEIYEVF